MHCPECEGTLEIIRACWKVAMRCGQCGREFQIHEVADRLDPETEEKLSNYTSIIYD